MQLEALTSGFDEADKTALASLVKKLNNPQVLGLINQSLFGNSKGSDILRGLQQKWGESIKRVMPKGIEKALSRTKDFIWGNKNMFLLFLLMQGPGILAKMLLSEER
jgi:hypothetical protein